MDQEESEVLSHLHFPAPHRVKLHSANTLDRLNKEVKRRANVVGIFPNEARIRRLIGAVLMEHRSSTCAVLRRRFSCGCETHPVTFTPTGSNWSSQGGNKLAEASGAEGY